jgi:hypothetical protein
MIVSVQDGDDIAFSVVVVVEWHRGALYIVAANDRYSFHTRARRDGKSFLPRAYGIRPVIVNNNNGGCVRSDGMRETRTPLTRVGWRLKFGMMTNRRL